MSALPLVTALALARACAPAIAPQTLLSVVQAESGLDPLVIGVNGRPRTSLHPADRADAVRRARALVAEGRDLDLGLAQINVRNLAGLRLSLDQAFDPCLNLRSGGEVLARSYERLRGRRSDPQATLTAALSAYNTGDPERGVRNGYVAQVHQAAVRVVPAIAAIDRTQGRTPATPDAPSEPPTPVGAASAAARARADDPALDVFARPAGVLVDWSAHAAPSRPSAPLPSSAQGPSS